MSCQSGKAGGYPQMFVNQTPVYDNAVRKGRKRKKKKASHARGTYK